ncbi:hypothetical protein LTR10_012647 [Elasticomyces elasticus]|uniref:Carboxylic ester hydrolase n=1 Tax=Exophiala sideris TaxID=1016849 RepID=A0ABR0JRE4_9EURO|nr:hypothetical protein LTR10_012647 [Elasticomyces elasticus]KAK5040153.1 hypothetical protein LTS07_000650 [Exophiala sideris]KAK5043422.1 hypothetical protein LTR13_001193 [Exophiala sideris]KAK5068531.1 hypothetical protein LTR69_000651 [Exophiala sideris]KAK5186129.1 hypothetical protein LTR44_001184 [Eurotiomycetes sp. CCFEE 6388]
MSTTTLKHPEIGEIKGQVGDGVHQFLGVQYGTIEDRFAESKVKSSYSSPVDATSHGPSSYYPPTAFDNEMGFIQQTLPKPVEKHSELECLNLNITVPQLSGSDGASQKLPVFIWQHGGGFILGSNSWPHYDHAKLVKLANEKGVPVIGVGINFRLGLSGLLTSEELRSHGYKTNNQFRDQRTAFKWVTEYISGFGGDPDNVTVIGESAGAVATTLHLYSKEKLFNRAIATGGSALLVPPFPLEAYEGVYQQVLGVFGLENLSPEDRVQKLLSIPMEDIIGKMPPNIPFLPTIDGDIIPVRPSYAAIADPKDETMPAKHWLDGLAIGDGQFDGSVMGFMLGHRKANILQTFPESIKNSLSSSPQVAEKLLEAYGFTGPAAAKGDEAAFVNFLQFATDIGYYAATTSFARGWPENKKIFTWFFNEPNPWSGPFQGRTTHVLDVVFLFQNFNDKLPAEQRAAAEGFAVDLMKFVSGQEPWPAYSPAHKTAKVFGPSKGESAPVTKVVDDAEGPETKRGLVILELGKEVGFDKLAEVFGRFQMGM